MIVDNNTSNINMLGIMLENRYKIVAFTNGRDAINYILEKRRPKLVLLDLVMPIISGEEVAEEINEMCNFEIPIMFMGRENNERMKFACEEAKAVGVFTRPFNPTYIKREIAKVVEGER